MDETYVIVGANLAGGYAATTLRDKGFEGELVLIGEEPNPPYELPPLSKEYLRGETPFEKTHVIAAEGYQERHIPTRFGERVTRVDPKMRTAVLDSGEGVYYDKILICTGVKNRRLTAPGADLDGIFNLRTVVDADDIRQQMSNSRKAVLVGMGFIGAEVAASLRQSGIEVAVVEVANGPLIHAVGPEVSKVIEGIHRDHGVEMFLGEKVLAFQGDQRVERVLTASGRRIDCDFVVVGIGVEPVTDFLRGTEVQIDNGIVVDEFCRTNVEGIYAAGDVANHYHPFIDNRIRVEHWQNAMRQGAAAAQSMMGDGQPYEEVHWFWSDQYDCNIQSTGFPSEWDDVVVRGSLEERKFVAFYLTKGKVNYTVALNEPRDLRKSMALIKSGVRVEPDQLRDPEADLRRLASEGNLPVAGTLPRPQNL